MFECHITIEPVREDQLPLIEELATSARFKPAKLLMQNRSTGTLQRSMYDTFLTGHDQDYMTLHDRMAYLCVLLRTRGFAVWRYKIEEIKLDSRDADTLGLLSTFTPQPVKEL